LRFKKTLALQPDNPHLYYDIACVYALQKEVSESVDWLRRAIEKGFDDWNLIKSDKKLEAIRGPSEFKDLAAANNFIK
jgi:hypothetical protein